MQPARRITVIETSAILISTIIGVGVLPLPLFAVSAADSGAPLVTFVAMLFAFIGLALIALLGMRFPDQTIVQYGESILGKWAGRICSTLVVAFFAVLTSLTAREFGEVVVTSVLTRTPVEVTVIVMLLLAALSTRNTITTVAHIHYFYTPFILFPAIFIVVLSLKNAETLNLLPIWGNEPSGMVRGVITIAALFQGSFILTSVIPSMRRPELAMRASLIGMLVSGGLYIAIVVATVGVFGSEETKLMLWPTLELAKATSLPANVLERLDAAFLAVWVTAVFTTLLSSYFLTIQSASQMLRLQDHRMLSFFLLPFVFVMAMLPPNIVRMYQIVELVGRIGLYITIAYPALLLLVAILRNKRGERTGAQARL